MKPTIGNRAMGNWTLWTVGVCSEGSLYLCGWAGCRSHSLDDEPCQSLAGRPADAHRTTQSDPWRAERENKTSSHIAQHFPKLITTSQRFQLSDSGFFSLKWGLGKPSVLKILICDTEMRLGSICIIYAFVLWALEVEWGMSMDERERLFPRGCGA